MFDACRSTVQVSRLLEDGVDATVSRETRGTPHSRIDMLTAFHLATAGGGVALDLPIGLFRPGYQFDALVLDPEAAGGSIRLFGETEPMAVLEKVLHTAGPANIAAVYVSGECISPRPILSPGPSR